MEKQLIPRLRFSEFFGKWEGNKLGDITNYTKGYAFKSKNYKKKGIRVVRVSDLGADTIKEDNDNKYIELSKEKEFSKYKLFENEIIITTVGSRPDLIESSVGRGIFIYNDGVGLLNQNMLKIHNTEKVINKFLFGYLNSPKYFNYINDIKRGNANQANITVIDLLKYRIYCPSLSEQQKIASFLTAVDDKITQLTKKKELLEQYKKGVMQKIFKQELRFKDDDGNEFTEWEEKKLGDIGSFQTSSVDKLSKPDEQEVFLVNYMNVYRHETISNETVKSFQVVTANKNQLQSSNLLKGDILFTPSSETPTDIGHSVVIFEDIDNAVYSYHLIRFRPKIKLDLMFSHYFCNTSEVLRQLSRFSTGSTRFTISIGNFSKVIANYPCLEEQTKIANFLSDIDLKIEGLHSKIENSKAFKKGLLQQMFV